MCPHTCGTQDLYVSMYLLYKNTGVPGPMELKTFMFPCSCYIGTQVSLDQWNPGPLCFPVLVI